MAGAYITETGDIQSTGWKEVTMKLIGTDEEIRVPFMISTRVSDVKAFLAEMTGEQVGNIELMVKIGPSLRRQRDGDEVQTKLTVKGLQTFARYTQTYPHPFLVIGMGVMGMRQTIHWVRMKADFMTFERNDDLGGNAWLLIGNHSSKLQTEGVHYQLQYDAEYGGMDTLCHIEEMGYWPSRGEIISHYRRVADEYNIWPFLRLQTELTEMSIIPEKRHFSERAYDMTWESTKEGDTSKGTFRCSCITYFPGCLVTPHRKVWPGEETFGGQIGYGFGREFNFAKVAGQDGVIIGQGAFSHENVRSFCENAGNKVYVIARHWNLMLPRLLSWWINQAVAPLQAAMVLQGMTPMYKLMGWDQWSWYSVTANSDRTIATIKQYTRWGISDLLFLAVYWGKAEIFEAEIKRFKYRTAVLNNGKVIENVDHIMKVIGFDGDWGVDRLMQSKHHVGMWPNGDWRRWVLSDNSAIDASRFNAMSIAPGASSWCRQTGWYFAHPDNAIACLNSGIVPKNYADTERGSPCYHYEPRVHVTVWMTLGVFSQEIAAFNATNDPFKKQSMHVYLPIDKYILACKEDWDHYCLMFKEQGWDKPWPEYPYKPEFIKECVRMEEEELTTELTQKAASKTEKSIQEALSVRVLPGTGLSMEPARHVLRCVNAQANKTITNQDKSRWLSESQGIRQFIVDGNKGKQ